MSVAESELFIENGNALLYYAFDVGAGIDLVKAENLLGAEKKKSSISEKRRQAKYFEFTPPPVRFVDEGPVLEIGFGFSTASRIEVLVFDFGCVSVRFEVPIRGPVDDIIRLSSELYENHKLQDQARNSVASLFERIKPAIDRPEIAARIEDYCIFHFSKLRGNPSIKKLLADHITPLAGLLRAEVEPPSDRELQEILNDRISYGSKDVTLMSWFSAVIYGENAEDIYTVLEFTNLVLMELSYLDSRLDKSLDEFYDYFTVHQKKRPFFDLSTRQPAVRRITQLQIDSAISFERITNALKLMGDDFQARVFQLATRKMGVSSWDASITRKLQTIESIYQKISDSEAARRMEVLELIIIVLITVSIFLPMLMPMRH